MKSKLLILGATGMLGHIVYLFLKSTEKYSIINTSFRKKLTDDTILLNLRNEIETKEFLIKERPDIVINCVGVLLKGSILSPSNAVFLNAYLPHFLSERINQYGGKLIHISTDCVFSGKSGNYKENDLKDAQDIYGLSKSLGEVKDNRNLTLRTSIIGPELKNGEGLFHWFMNQNNTVSGYKKVIWNGVTTLELAKSINKAIDLNLTGIYNVAPFEKISKYDLLNIMNKVFNKNLTIESNYEVKIDRSLIDSRKEIKCEHRNYSEMFFELKNFMINNLDFYKHYNIWYG